MPMSMGVMLHPQQETHHKLMHAKKVLWLPLQECKSTGGSW